MVINELRVIVGHNSKWQGENAFDYIVLVHCSDDIILLHSAELITFTTLRTTCNFVSIVLSFQAIPSMLLALVLWFDHRKSRDTVSLLDLHSLKGHKYIWYALPGYAIGLVAALAAGILTHSPQPALLYLVIFDPCFVDFVVVFSWQLGSQPVKFIVLQSFCH